MVKLIFYLVLFKLLCTFWLISRNCSVLWEVSSSKYRYNEHMPYRRQFGNKCIILHCKNIISNSDCPSGCRVHVFMFLYLQLVCIPFIACQLRSQLRFQNFYCALIVILPLFSTEVWSHMSRVDGFSATVRNTTSTHKILKLHLHLWYRYF
jgi:hypothetical protein